MGWSATYAAKIRMQPAAASFSCSAPGAGVPIPDIKTACPGRSTRCTKTGPKPAARRVRLGARGAVAASSSQIRAGPAPATRRPASSEIAKTSKRARFRQASSIRASACSRSLLRCFLRSFQESWLGVLMAQRIAFAAKLGQLRRIHAVCYTQRRWHRPS